MTPPNSLNILIIDLFFLDLNQGYSLVVSLRSSLDMSSWLISWDCTKSSQKLQSIWKLPILYLGKQLIFSICAFRSLMKLSSLKRSSIINLSFFFCSMFSLLFLHFFLYGCNIFAWRKTRINYSFIFELAPTKELKYRDVFLICTTSMTVVMGVMFVHLSFLTKGYSYTQVQAIPGLLLLVMFLVLFNP